MGPFTGGCLSCQAPSISPVPFNSAGHTFFLEDGVEQGNYITGNLGMLTYPSNALLNTDTSPAVFWITHPNNVVRNNVGAGVAPCHIAR